MLSKLCGELYNVRPQIGRPQEELVELEPCIRVMAGFEPKMTASLAHQAE
jgi:hypothetical protein